MKSAFLGAMILGLACLAGCGTVNAANDTTSAKQTTNSNTNTTSATTISRQLTKSDMKIGNLFIGQELSNVQSIYGKPSVKTVMHGNGAPEWKYTKQGFSVGGSPAWTISISSGFSGSTPRGIHVGSTAEAVKKVYPTYKMVQDGAQIFVESSDKLYDIDFGLKSQKVEWITLANEKP